VKAVAKGFAIFTQEDVQILAGPIQRLNIALLIQMEEEKVRFRIPPRMLTLLLRTTPGWWLCKERTSKRFRMIPMSCNPNFKRCRPICRP